MPDLKLYDYQRPPEMPEGVYRLQYFFAQKKYKQLLYPSAPWLEGPCMVLMYDKDDNLLLTRFIFRDGTYKDAT
jgi:hypothetical protein